MIFIVSHYERNFYDRCDIYVLQQSFIETLFVACYIHQGASHSLILYYVPSPIFPYHPNMKKSKSCDETARHKQHSNLSNG